MDEVERYKSKLLLSQRKVKILEDIIESRTRDLFLKENYITKQALAEIELKEQKNFYENILHSIPVDIAIFDKNHKYLFLNKEALNDDTLREWMVGKDDFDYAALKGLPASFAQQRKDMFNQVINSSKTSLWMDKQIAKTGEVRYKQRRLQTFADKQTVVGYAVDVTELHNAQLELLKSQEDLIAINKNLEIEIEKRIEELKESMESRTREMLVKEHNLQNIKKGLLNILEDYSEEKAKVESINEDLISANKELDAFTYSVSHDLRAPLRGVNGFAKMLLEEYGAKLDAEGNRLLNNIMSSAKKMGQLIDDLLAFSRLGRKELMMNNIRMHDMVSEINEELKNKHHPNIEFLIKQLLPAKADNAAIKQVWVNLISNAIKYSEKKDKAIIEFGSEEKGNEITYYIKDNGAGFDMRYADKLFGIFQRLHSDKEFEGTGVGLAMVQRIIAKHGGRVWAEGKVGEGATFYFSLPRG